MDGTSRGGKEKPYACQSLDVYAEEQQWMAHLSRIVPSFFLNLSCMVGLYETRQLFRTGLNHGMRGLCSLMFIAGGLKCRKGLWECQQSRKGTTSLVPLTSRCVSSAFETAACAFSSPHGYLCSNTKMLPPLPHLHMSAGIGSYFLEALCNQSNTNKIDRAKGGSK